MLGMCRGITFLIPKGRYKIKEQTISLAFRHFAISGPLNSIISSSYVCEDLLKRISLSNSQFGGFFLSYFHDLSSSVIIPEFGAGRSF